MENRDIQTQTEYLEETLRSSELMLNVLKLAPQLELPHWYLGAGSIAQTVWNKLHDYAPARGIKDYDLVYFDSNTSVEEQDKYIAQGNELFKHLPVDVEITNEARVHLWYKQEFGKEMIQYHSSEEAIDTWPTTATAIGVRYEGSDFKVYAPYGLHDLLAMIVRPNKTLITHKVYEDKVERWKRIWPKLTIIRW